MSDICETAGESEEQDTIVLPDKEEETVEGIGGAEYNNSIG